MQFLGCTCVLVHQDRLECVIHTNYVIMIDGTESQFAFHKRIRAMQNAGNTYGLYFRLLFLSHARELHEYFRDSTMSFKIQILTFVDIGPENKSGFRVHSFHG